MTRACELLRRAYVRIRQIADAIPEPAWRERFLKNQPQNARIIAQLHKWEPTTPPP
jgi:hypothetical protein